MILIDLFTTKDKWETNSALSKGFYLGFIPLPRNICSLK